VAVEQCCCHLAEAPLLTAVPHDMRPLLMTTICCSLPAQTIMPYMALLAGARAA